MYELPGRALSISFFPRSLSLFLSFSCLSSYDVIRASLLAISWLSLLNRVAPESSAEPNISARSLTTLWQADPFEESIEPDKYVSARLTARLLYAHSLYNVFEHSSLQSLRQKILVNQ